VVTAGVPRRDHDSPGGGDIGPGRLVTSMSRVMMLRPGRPPPAGRGAAASWLPGNPGAAADPTVQL
jgi:hypothetical protein